MRLALVAMLVAASLGAGESERGRVGVRNLRTRDLEALGAKAGPQNFAIVQDQRGLVYLANNLGVVELDQHAARLITLPHRASALSLDLGARATGSGSAAAAISAISHRARRGS